MLGGQAEGQESLIENSNSILRNCPNGQPDSEHEGHAVLTQQLFQQRISRELKFLKVIAFLGVAIGLLCLTYTFLQRKQISQISEKYLSQSYEVANLMYQVEHYKQQTNALAKNLSLLIDEVRLETIKIEVDIAKLQSHNKNILDITRFEKKDLWDYNHQMQENRIFRQSKSFKQLIHIKHFLNQPALLPKIVWLYTEFPFQSEKMLEQLLGNFIITMAKESGYEIRTVNSWSAYQWLSNATTSKITKTMQNRVIEQKVDDLLRIALLMEHGGIAVKVSESFLIQNFDWVKQHLPTSEGSSLPFRKQVLLFSESMGPNTKIEYQDFFIAAIPRAALVVDMFDVLCETIRTGKLQFTNLKDAFYQDRDVGAKRIRALTKNIIQSLVEVMNTEYYSLSIVNNDISLFVTPNCRDRIAFRLKKPDFQFKEACGQHAHIVHISSQNDRRIIEEQLQWELSNEVLGADRQGYWHTLMVIKENRRLFDPSPPRQVSYCLIDAHPSSNFEQLKASFQRIKSQTYKQWTAVYFVDKQQSQSSKYAQSQRKQGFNINLVKDSGSIGRNYEIGIIKYCPSKSFVFVLRRYQEIEDNLALQVLSGTLAPRPVLGVFVGVQINGIVSHSDTYFQYYNKPEFNGRNPKYDVLSRVLNYLRVFHSDCYKIIPQFVLRTHEGQYFEDRFVFLQQFLYMVRNLTELHDETQIPHTQRVKWFIKSNADLFDVPNRIVLHRNLVVKTPAWQEVNKAEIKRNNHKIDSYSMSYNMDHMVQNGIPMSEFAVFNPGLQYEPYTVRNKPQLIPKIVHIIWIEGTMPETKRRVFQMNKALYPDFTFKIWTKENVTRQKFPLNYDLLKTIYNMENISRYSKRATMADVLRHQLLYYEGGFYMDTSMVLFNNIFYKWLSYKFVLATERTFRHRWAQSMCFFGVMPKFPGLLRIISHNNTNRYQIWKRDAMEIAGPHNFRWTVRGMQEYDPDYLIMDYQTFYPMTYSLPNHWDSYCFIEPMYLSQQDEPLMTWKGRYILKNCGKYYPFGFGKQINGIGGSWQNPKW